MSLLSMKETKNSLIELLNFKDTEKSSSIMLEDC